MQDSPRILMAPMEGVVDDLMRHIITGIGGIDICVTEFVRVTDRRLPSRVFYRLCPELHHQSQTASGVPVRIQLLGGKAQVLAANALQAAKLGASAIDLNFGCPAKLVNRHDGGAVLLNYPERLYDIVAWVRDSVPAEIPVTAKIRLGDQHPHAVLENALEIERAGASELVIHARTKADGYKPPAHWHLLAPVVAALTIPVIANGEVWTVADWRRCTEASQCRDVMIGRGLLSRPDLALAIKAEMANEDYSPMPWSVVVHWVFEHFQASRERFGNRFRADRTKQWLAYLQREYVEAAVLFKALRVLKTPDDIAALLSDHCQ